MIVSVLCSTPPPGPHPELPRLVFALPSGAYLAFCVGPFPVPLVLHPDWILIGFVSPWCSCVGGTLAPSPALIALCCCSCCLTASH